MCCVLILYRSFTQPNPPGRVILDAVSSLTTVLIKSLKLGCVRGCKFNVCFHRDAFNFLFNNCDSSVRRRPGKLFNRSDFNSVYFSDSNFDFTARALRPNTVASWFSKLFSPSTLYYALCTPFSV